MNPMTCRNIAFTRWLLAACLVTAPALVAAARSLSQDETFLAAHKAFRAGNATRIARYATQLDGYLLKPWAEYWSLSTGIDGTPNEEIRAFLRRYADSYLAEALRREWLRVLGRKEQWEQFVEQEGTSAADDPEISCYGLLARSHQGEEDLDLARFRDHWYAPRDLPQGCLPLANEALRSGQFGSQQVWERFRLLVGANAISAAKRTLGMVPRRDAPRAGQFDKAAYSPSDFLAHLPDVRDRGARELAILAFSRLARHDPKLAASRWKKVQSRFPADDQGYVWGRIATEAARRHVSDAVEWFGEAVDARLDDVQLAWKARIALRHANWTEVRRAIERMSPRAQREPAWVYWMGRARRELNALDHADATFSRIAGMPEFYGQLASEELGRSVQLPPRAAAPTEEELAGVARHPGLRRALALFRLGLRVEGTREWNWAIQGMDDRTLLAAAELARRNEVWDRSINTADRTVALHDYALRYPTPYADVLIGQARSNEIEEHWVLGLVRQESRFVANARSSAGASGLMQLMPATARSMARRIGLRGYAWSRVTDVGVNAQLGTAYLKQVLDFADGSMLLALTGYNAGPGRAQKWRDARPIEGAIYAESIPFSETRNYVKRVMADSVLYSAVLGGSNRPLKQRLGVIEPRSSAGRTSAIP